MQEVKNYSAKFWELGPSRLSNWDSIEKQIEKGEGKIQKRQECMNAVKRKVRLRCADVGRVWWPLATFFGFF